MFLTRHNLILIAIVELLRMGTAQITFTDQWTKRSGISPIPLLKDLQLDLEACSMVNAFIVVHSEHSKKAFTILYATRWMSRRLLVAKQLDLEACSPRFINTWIFELSEMRRREMAVLSAIGRCIHQ
uniref:Secreted protein n=1 Tax=Ascaris lumbricoides TaxID=6252 RepID=A0A0M3HZI1_ASCLU